MSPFELGRALWEARVRAAWGAYAPTIMARTPWPDHIADPNIAAEHQLCIVQARAAIEALREEIAEHPGPHSDEAASWRSELARITLTGEA